MIQNFFCVEDPTLSPSKHSSTLWSTSVPTKLFLFCWSAHCVCSHIYLLVIQPEVQESFLTSSIHFILLNIKIYLFDCLINFRIFFPFYCFNPSLLLILFDKNIGKDFWLFSGSFCYSIQPYMVAKMIYLWGRSNLGTSLLEKLYKFPHLIVGKIIEISDYFWSYCPLGSWWLPFLKFYASIIPCIK